VHRDGTSLCLARQYGVLPVLLQAQALKEFYSNADAGADVAAQMLQLAGQLQAAPGIPDMMLVVRVSSFSRSSCACTCKQVYAAGSKAWGG
jgi:hypothetical protein